MKKTLALILACLMVLSAVSMLSVVSFADEPTTVELTGGKYADGMENWSNNTQLLYGIVYDDTIKTEADAKAIFDARADYTWTLKISTNADMSDAQTKVMTPSSAIGNMNTYYGFRFTPCLAEGENQWIPVKDTVYYIDLTIEGTDVVYEVTGNADGYKLPGVDPIVPAPVEPSEPSTITLVPLFGAWENWKNSPNNPNPGEDPGVTQLLIGLKEGDAKTPVLALDGGYTWKLTIAAGEESKTITMAPTTYYAAENLYRFETCLGEGENQFVPVKDTEYTVTMEIYEGETLLYKSEPTAGFTCPMDPVVPTPVEPDPEPQGPTYKVNGTVLTVLADVVGEGDGENRVFPWADVADKITKVVIAKGVTKIDQRAFTKFPKLEEVVVADTVTEIGQDAFSYNGKLTTLTIPSSVTTIGQGIVYSCSAITTVYGDWESADAFKAVWSVKNYNTDFENAELKTYEDYTLVDGVLTVYKDIEADTEEAYPWASDKASIKKIVIWDTVTTIGARAFSHCDNLEEVVVGNGVLVINQDAFSYCPKLTTITVPSTVGEIGQGIVYSSSAITTVYGGWETAEEFKAIWSVKNYNESFEGEGVEYLLIGTVKEPPVDPDPKPPVDPDPKPPVDPDDPTTDPDDPTTDPGTTDEEEEGGFPVWAIVVIVIAVVAVAAGVVVVLKKKKN